MADAARAVGESWTYGDYRTWPEDERRELIEGHAWAMSPAPMTRHQEISARLFNHFYDFHKGTKKNDLAANCGV